MACLNGKVLSRVVVVDRFYIALFSALEQTHYARMWFYLKFKCCCTSTETVGLLGTGAQDVHLNFHTAPELCVILHEWLAFYSVFFNIHRSGVLTGMAGATWNCCHLGAFCVNHTIVHHVTSCKVTYIGCMTTVAFSVQESDLLWETVCSRNEQASAIIREI